MSYLTGVLGLLDHTIQTMLGVPVFAAFLGAFVMAAVLGLYRMLSAAAGGTGRARR